MESSCRIVHAYINAEKLQKLKYGKKAAVHKKFWIELSKRRDGYYKLYRFISNEADRNYISWQIKQLTDLMLKVSKHF